MLSWLSIQGLALVDSVELALDPGLNILTGETGAAPIFSNPSRIWGGRPRKDASSSGGRSISKGRGARS